MITRTTKIKSYLQQHSYQQAILFEMTGIYTLAKRFHHKNKLKENTSLLVLAEPKKCAGPVVDVDKIKISLAHLVKLMVIKAFYLIKLALMTVTEHTFQFQSKSFN